MDTSTSLPPALRQVNPRRLSAGLFAAIDRSGGFEGTQLLHSALIEVGDRSKGGGGTILDARVGQNIRLGGDPNVLPVTQRGQAEPHIYRSITNPNVLLGTFQEGRFADGGALDCGYAITLDGGLTWTRALIPQLTQSSGGPYDRATDPVASIGPQGDLYLNTLASVRNAFALGAVVVSRSIDNGVTWSAPAVVFQSPNAQAMPDKEWLAVNDYAGTPTAARLVVTWTNFTSTSNGTATGDNLLSSLSDDRGATWNTPVAITPAGALNQGSQPVFLPDGSLVVVYITFLDANTTTLFSIQCKRSSDGGRTYPSVASNVAASVTGWDDPDLRAGTFLPAATVSRQTGVLFVTYVAVVAGTPRVMVIRSSDKGSTWSAPIIVSDNPATVSVMNPAIAVTPDGQNVSAVFMDKRNASDGHNFIDLYAAQSFDGGITWQPNIRLTETSSDIRYAPLTSEGYMLGDYLGVAPALSTSQPSVAIWCDTRSGDSDPFTVRFTPSPVGNYDSWRIARGVGAGSEDPDADGLPNVLEYALGTNPLVAESGEALVLTRGTNGDVDVAAAVRPDFAGQLTVGATDPQTGQPIAVPIVPDGAAAPDTAMLPGLAWKTFALKNPPNGVRLTLVAENYADALDRRTPGLQMNGIEQATINTDSRLINVSTRAVVASDANQLIVGFVVDGSKTILLRAAGPALTQLGVSGTLAHPVLSVPGIGGAIAATNTSWQQDGVTSDLFTRLGAFPFPIGSSNAALLVNATTGSHTAIVSGANGGTGIALVEAYDADALPGAPNGARLVNLSTRGAVGTDADSALIGGFVISGAQPRRVLIRAVGPSLTKLGVPGAIMDPVLSLYGDAKIYGSAPVATNDDWQLTRSAAAIDAVGHRLGAFPLDAPSLDAALLITLPPGNYTAVVTGVGSTTGVALIELYDAD